MHPFLVRAVPLAGNAREDFAPTATTNWRAVAITGAAGVILGAAIFGPIRGTLWNWTGITLGSAVGSGESPGRRVVRDRGLRR